MDPIQNQNPVPESDFIFRIYESSLVYWLIAFGILGIIFYSILIYVKIKMGDKWKDGIVKWMLRWYLDKAETQIRLTKDSDFITPLFEKIKEKVDKE